MKKILTIFLFVVLMSACGGSSVAPASEVVSTASSTSESTTTLTLTAQEVIDKSKMVMYQLSEYWFLQEFTIKSSNFEFTITEIGNFQSPDKSESIMEYPGGGESYISIGKTCYVGEEKPGGKEWSEYECSGVKLYELFVPTNN